MRVFLAGARDAWLLEPEDLARFSVISNLDDDQLNAACAELGFHLEQPSYLWVPENWLWLQSGRGLFVDWSRQFAQLCEFADTRDWRKGDAEKLIRAHIEQTANIPNLTSTK